LNLNL
jgi:hypothetical protein